MILVRILVLEQMIHNARVFCKYVKSKDNNLADHLSRMKIHLFKDEGGDEFDETPTPIPEALWPMSKVWVD